jgi:hypothetical protein
VNGCPKSRHATPATLRPDTTLRKRLAVEAMPGQ